jgi:hypothetical protein
MPTSEKIAAVIFVGGVASIYLLEILSISLSVLARIHRTTRKSILWRKCTLPVHLLAAIGVLCLLYGYFVEPYWVEVSAVPIKTPDLAESSYRIVQISDLHCDKEPRNEYKLVDLVNRMEPDVIVFAGDTLNTPSQSHGAGRHRFYR